MEVANSPTSENFAQIVQYGPAEAEYYKALFVKFAEKDNPNRVTSKVGFSLFFWIFGDPVKIKPMVISSLIIIPIKKPRTNS